MGSLKDSDPPEIALARIFNDCQQSQACHRRCIKELVKCRRRCSPSFDEFWIRCMFPLFGLMKKEAPVERLVKFISSVATYRDEDGYECDAFLERFLGFLVSAADATNKFVRYRSCQILSEIILSLPGETEVSAELWDEMSSCMQRRIQDKLPAIRIFAARSLSLFGGEDDNDPIILQYKLCLSADPSAEVRKAALLSLPVSNVTISDIVERTRDVSDAVRKAAYSVLGSQVPVESLSIRQRVLVLQRGLADREPSVQVECIKMLKEGWLSRGCMTLLSYLDVETNEKVGESVMLELLNQGAIKIDGESALKDYVESGAAETEQGWKIDKVRLLEPEEALYWRMVCNHLSSESQAKRLQAANTGGAKADVLEAEADDKNEILDAILPPTVADFVVMVEAHYLAGSSRAFASRQLLMLAELLDFTDTANRRAAAGLIENILRKPAEAHHGDAIYLGGEKEWSEAAARLAHKVHASQGAFEEAMTKVVVELARPCREGGANVLEWLQCLAVTSILLENLKFLQQLPRHLIEPQEMVDGLLLQAAVHPVPEVQRAGLRCLSLYCQLEDRPSAGIVQKLQDAISSTSHLVKEMAVKGLFDLVMCHGIEALNKATGADIRNGATPQPRGPAGSNLPEENKYYVPILQALADVLGDSADVDTQEELEETAKALGAKGFAKLLIQSNHFPELQEVQLSIFPKLLHLYFDDATDMPRLRQWLSVFFHSYASVSAEHKRCIAKIFVPTLRAAWPGISSPANPHTAAARRKSAAQLSRFMLELIKQPLFARKRQGDSSEDPESVESVEAPDEGNEHLAINLASEIVKGLSRKPAILKPYRSALCKVLVALEFRPAQQGEIKCMRKLLDMTMEVMSGEKLILKELKAMASQLKAMDKVPEDVLTIEQLQPLLDSLKLDVNLSQKAVEEAPTPAVRTSKKKRQTSTCDEESDFETPSATLHSQAAKTGMRTRSQRTCKTTAIQRMQSISKTRAIDFDSDTDEQ